MILLSDEIPDLSPRFTAIVASDGKVPCGCVLWHEPRTILASEIEDFGLRSLDELGLHLAPHGISVVTGLYIWHPGGYEYPQDGEFSVEDVKFRPPTDEEWKLIQAGVDPWAEQRNLLEETLANLPP